MDITAGYKPGRCILCYGNGVLYLAIAGDHISEIKPVPRNHKAPWVYCYQSTIPCDCPAGVHYATAAKRLRRPDGVHTVTIRTPEWQRLVNECVFDSPWSCSAFTDECRAMRDGRKYPGSAEKHPNNAQTAQTPSLNIERALRAISGSIARHTPATPTPKPVTQDWPEL